MNQRDALLAAVCGSPEDGLPRMMFADWLEGIGEQDRCDFIRAQVELARLESIGFAHAKAIVADRSRDSGEPDGHEAERIELRRRERELLEANFCNWVPLSWHQGSGVGIRLRIDSPIVVEFTGSWLHAVIFRRGFVDWMSCSWADWLAHHERLFWHSSQTVECPNCGRCSFWHCGQKWNIKMGPPPVPRGKLCDGTGRIPRPFDVADTAQPIRRVQLTDWPHGVDFPASEAMQAFYAHPRFFAPSRFDRVPCPACIGERINRQGTPATNPDWNQACPRCHGTPLNEWLCERWPGVVFEMPQASGLLINRGTYGDPDWHPLGAALPAFDALRRFREATLESARIAAMGGEEAFRSEGV